MYPALEAGQLVFALHTKQISRGDVVVFRHEGIEKIKRVVGMEGDFVYVLGDNPRFSTDSRQFGYIKQSTIAGRVVWPKV
ncbi:S26 family signal peptidase [Candidatus Saccharibacteria bacterium]|jgi:phage repressor protein C with HTH and peptisase S24 domain|nr:S26 family signal peptidase [Candidatus Saccharibacteria bacterium]